MHFRSCCEGICSSVALDGKRIHELLQSTFEAVHTSRASPAWLKYTGQLSDIVFKGLRTSVLASLNSMLDRISLSPEAEVGDFAILYPQFVILLMFRKR